MLGAADAAMYSAKRAGGNRVSAGKPITALTASRELRRTADRVALTTLGTRAARDRAL
jgi:hypothetical protein